MHPYSTGIVYEKPEDAERLYRIGEIEDLYVSDKVILNSIYMPDQLATYDATVVGVYQHHIVLEVTIRQNTAYYFPLGEPQPYKYSVAFKDIGKTAFIWKPIDESQYLQGSI